MVAPSKLGHIVLAVDDVQISTGFYEDILGLRVTARMSDSMVFLSSRKNASHELALIKIKDSNVDYHSNGSRVVHFAWQMASFEDLKEIYSHLLDKKIKITRLGDHGISMGIYFFDPDGNEIEVFFELPQEQWPDKDIFSGQFPMKLQ